MRAIQIDRIQLGPEHSAHVSDEVAHIPLPRGVHFCASPSEAQILRPHAPSYQTFCLAKILFPHGDAACLRFGFNQNGKIIGSSLVSMAGD